MSTAPDSLSVVICAYTEDRWADIVAAVGVGAEPGSAPARDRRGHRPQPGAAGPQPRSASRASTDTVVVANAEAQGPLRRTQHRHRGLRGLDRGVPRRRRDGAAGLDRPACSSPYADPDVLGVGGRVVPRWDAARPAWLPEEFDWVVGCTYAGHRDVAGPVRNLIGANMSVRRDVVRRDRRLPALTRPHRVAAGRVRGDRALHPGHAALPARHGLVPAATPRSPTGCRRAAPPRSTSGARCFAEGISKTQISRLVGTQDGLASERAYTTRTLPRAFVRELRRVRRTPGHRRRRGRAAALVTGVATTAAGYAAARVPGSDRWLASRNPEPRRSSPPT